LFGMSKIIATLAVALALLVGGVTLPADQAEAHQFDGMSTIYCTAHKSDPGDHVWVNHSWPVNLQPGLVTYKCTQYDVTVFGHPEHQYHVVVHTPSGAHWRQGGYVWCGSNPCVYH
jgi:hypothetical protein